MNGGGCSSPASSAVEVGVSLLQLGLRARNSADGAIRRFLRRMKRIVATMRARRMTPAMTPPAIAPAFGPDGDAFELELGL